MHAFAKFSATELIPLPWGPPIIQVKLFVTVKFPHYYVIVYYRKFFAPTGFMVFRVGIGVDLNGKRSEALENKRYIHRVKRKLVSP